MIDPKRKRCGAFADRIYMPTCTRVCSLCCTFTCHNDPLLVSKAEERFGLERELLESLPRIRSVPPLKRKAENKDLYGLEHVDCCMARRLAVAYHGSVTALEYFVATEQVKRWEAKIEERARDAGPTPRCQFRTSTHNFLSYAPLIIKSTNTAEWGFYCAGCKDGNERGGAKFYRRKYCVETFEAHLQECSPVMDGVHRPVR